jgi:hypothetical protein
MTASIATYPALPTLSPARPDETTRQYGLRAFGFLLAEGLCAAVLDTATLEHAAAASQAVVGSPELLDATREKYRAVRFDIMTTIRRRQQDAADLAHLAEIRQRLAAKRAEQAPPPAKDGGAGVLRRRPTPIVPPAGAAAPRF